MHPPINRRALLAGGAALGASVLTSPSSLKAAAPMAGSTGSPYMRYKVGEFEITAFNDGTRAMDNPEKIFGVNQRPEDVAAAAAANFLPADKMVNGFTPVLVNTGKELVLFDSGNGANGRPATGQLASQMKAAGIAPEQIDVVVISHCHPDHIGGLMEDGKPFAPNARYVIGEVEYGFWSSPERATGPTANAAKLVQSNVVPLKDKMTFLKNDGEVVGGIRAVEAFGHTPGHLAWHVESGGQEYNFKEYIDAVGTKAREIFRQAERIEIIGYSFRAPDKKWLVSLLGNAPEAKKLIINPHARSICEELEHRDGLTNLVPVQRRWGE